MASFSLTRLFLKTIGKWIPSDWFAYRLPVSVKGICFIDGKVILLQNERGEWDLPGGKMGRRENVQEALRREVHEELGIEVYPNELLDVFQVRVYHQVNVLLIVYRCSTTASEKDLVMSNESFALQLFSVEKIPELRFANDKILDIVRSAFVSV